MTAPNLCTHYAYILRCADGSLYSGYTTDPARRTAVHNSGKGAKYTRTRTPVDLVFVREFDTKSEALKFEISLKKLTRLQKLALIAAENPAGTRPQTLYQLSKEKYDMQDKLEVFFDYTCPFCLQGHEYLMSIVSRCPELAVEPRPCEAHPRSDRYGAHSDLAARGMYYAKDAGVPLRDYHALVYRAAVTELANIEDVDIMAEIIGRIADAGEFKKAVAAGLYADLLARNNLAAWSECAFEAVPSYRLNGKLLSAVPGVGVTLENLEEFIAENLTSSAGQK